MTLLRNRSSPAMTHYGMGIYNDNTIISSIYANQEVRYTNYMPTPQAYNINVVDRSHIVTSVSSIYVNIYNSYSSTAMFRWINYNAYIFEHISNIHNGFVPPYSPKCVNTFFVNTLCSSVIYEVTNEPTSQVLAPRHGFLKKQEKPECPIF
jgi:hypothetical protein